MGSKLGALLDARERRAVTLSAFAASCLCFAPGQIVSGAFLLVVSFVLWRWDERLLRLEEPPPPAGQPTGDER